MDDKKINSSNDDYIDKLISEIEDTGDILDTSRKNRSPNLKKRNKTLTVQVITKALSTV